MATKQRKLFTIVLYFMLALAANAQPYCSLKTFNLRDGLASNVITGIEQTDDQLMWFSTWSGLASYDGYRFTNYFDAPGGQNRNPRVLTTNRMLTIRPNSQGDIWCVTYDLNPYLFNRKEGKYIDMMEIINRLHGIRFQCNGAIPLNNGHTWLLSANEGVMARIDDSNYFTPEGVEIFRLGEGILEDRLFNWIYEDNDGDEWVITDKGSILLGQGMVSEKPLNYICQVGQLIYLAAGKGSIYSYDKRTKQLAPLPGCPAFGNIGLLNNVTDRYLTATTDQGVFIYDTQRQTGHLTSLPTDAQIIKHSRSTYADKKERLWMTCGDGTAILQISLNSGEYRLLQLTDRMPTLKQSNQSLFHEDQAGTIWAATEKGFFGYYDEEKGEFAPHPLRTEESQPVIDRWKTDEQGNLWFSNNHNLALVEFKHKRIRHFTNPSEVRSIRFDSQGRLWTGYRSGQLTCSKEGAVIGYLGVDGKLHNTPTDFSTHIYSIFEDSRQRLWIGTKGNGLYCLDNRGKLCHYAHDPADKGSLCSNQIYDIFEDQSGRIWVGTFERGICLTDESTDGNIRFIHADNGLTNYPIADFHKVRRITETADSVIIISCSNGLVAFKGDFTDPADIKFFAHKHQPDNTGSLLTSDVMQTFVASNDSVYVATVGGGLQVTHSKMLLQKELQLNDISHLTGNCGIIFGMAEDARGNLWIGCENSLNMYDVKEKNIWCFGPTYLGEDTRLAEALPTYNPQTDELVMATSSGSILFECKKMQEENFVPQLVFNNVKYHSTQEVKQTSLRDSLTVEPHQRNLTIYFAAIDYEDNHMIRYAYKLDGIDPDWNFLGSERNISFNNLPHGQHRLLVRSTNSYGTWVDNTRTLYLDVKPTFWESWRGKALQTLILIGIVVAAVWIYRLRIKAQMERKLDNMKLQFFTDISHKLRTPLTLIGGPITEVLDAGGLSETARKHLEMVSRNAHRMLELVNKMLTYSKEHHTYISDDSASVLLPEAAAEEGCNSDTAEEETKCDKPHLLIVEDNDDLRAFLAGILESEYRVTLAVNGRDGLEKAREAHPDFILTDVMMPEMDGLTMVHTIKKETETSHIPIVILSAKASMDDRLEGLKAGVNDYITKPFSATYLKQRMANIINNQRTLQQNYLEQIKQHTAKEEPEEGQIIRLTATNIVDEDKQMMEKLLAYIDEHIADPNLKIEDLAFSVCLGRTVFYSKVKKLVGISPVELLRQIRIQRAEDMVAKSTQTFAQIAYSVGFSDSRYFGKCFKQQTGFTPSEYRERAQGANTAVEKEEQIIGQQS